MLKIGLNPPEPYWLDLIPGVRLQFRPVTVAAILVARAAAAGALRAGGEDAAIKAGLAFTRSLAHFGIAAWEGIGDKDGNPVEPAAENIDAALEVSPIFDAIDRLYVAPAIVQDAEKKTPDRRCRMAFWRGRGLLGRLPCEMRRMPPMASMRRGRQRALRPGKFCAGPPARCAP